MMQPVEELHQLIAHKLRFVAHQASFLVAANVVPFQLHPSPIFAEIAQKIGAILLPLDSTQTEPTILICCFSGKSLAEAMGFIPQILQSSFMQANDKNKAYVLHEEWFLKADTLLQIESLAEIMYPNFFTFGHQGTAWVEIKA
jgi:hypothetical protein